MSRGPRPIGPEDPAAFEAGLRALLEALVRLGGYTHSGEELEARAERLSAELEARGLAVERIPGELAPHLLATTPAVREGIGSLLVGHYDTVAPPVRGGHRLEERGQRLVGPAVADMSAGLAALLGALDLLAEARLLEKIPLGVALVSDEEQGSPGGAELLRQAALAGAARALVFEPGRGEDAVILGRRGKYGLSFVIHGLEAHAGNAPEEGVNALSEAAALLGPLEALARERGASLVLGGRVEVHPGAENTVPGRVVLSGDLRFDANAGAPALLEGLSGLLQSTPARRAGRELAHNRMEIGHRRPAWAPSAGDQALYLAAEEQARRLGASLSCRAQGGSSDANTLAGLGVPVLDGLGPVGGDLHRPEEFILAASLPLRARLAAALIVALHDSRPV